MANTLSFKQVVTKHADGTQSRCYVCNEDKNITITFEDGQFVLRNNNLIQFKAKALHFETLVAAKGMATYYKNHLWN